MTPSDYAAALALAYALLVAVVAASTSLLDGWIDAHRRRRAQREDAYRRLLDGSWFR